MTDDDLDSQEFFGVLGKKELTHLPKATPNLPVVEFTQVDVGWPPKPLRLRQVKPLQGREITSPLTDELEQEVRTAALRTRRVRELLGKRFANIYTDLVRPPKGQSQRSTKPLATRLMFFSYTNNAAVQVLMEGTRVQRVGVVEGYQPPEGADEITDAIALARSDPRLKREVQGLAANSILLPNTGEDVGFGHRIMWVTFTDASDGDEEKPALFSAAVDLNVRRVIMARLEPAIEANDQKPRG